METTNKYIVTTEKAGIFYCEIESRRGAEADLLNARRIRYWEKAASTSQIAIDGVGAGSQLAMPVSATVLGVVEIIPVSEKAMEVLDKWPAWKM